MVYLINFGSTNPFRKSSKKLVKFEIISDEIIIGRGEQAHLQALENYVSNNHCSLKKVDNSWKICDFGSTNGTYLNSVKLKPHDWVDIFPGNVIQIGPSDVCRLKFYIVKNLKRKSSEKCEEIVPIKTLRETELQEELEITKHQLQKALEQNQDLILQEKQESNKIQESKTKIDALNQQVKDLEFQKQKEVEELTKLLNDKENDLIQKLEEQRLILENQLKELKANQEAESEQVQQLAAELSAKEQLVEKMKIDLGSSRENGKLEARKEFVTKLSQTVEEQFSCQICLETYVFAVTTDCGHSFCELCLRMWLAHEAKCPSCRSGVRAYPRNYVIDGYIDRLYETLTKESQEARTKLIDDHKVQLSALTNPRPGPSNQMAPRRANHGAARRPQNHARHRGGGTAPRELVRQYNRRNHNDQQRNNRGGNAVHFVLGRPPPPPLMNAGAANNGARLDTIIRDVASTTRALRSSHN